MTAFHGSTAWWLHSVVALVILLFPYCALSSVEAPATARTGEVENFPCLQTLLGDASVISLQSLVASDVVVGMEAACLSEPKGGLPAETAAKTKDEFADPPIVQMVTPTPEEVAVQRHNNRVVRQAAGDRAGYVIRPRPLTFSWGRKAAPLSLTPVSGTQGIIELVSSCGQSKQPQLANSRFGLSAIVRDPLLTNNEDGDALERQSAEVLIPVRTCLSLGQMEQQSGRPTVVTQQEARPVSLPKYSIKVRGTTATKEMSARMDNLLALVEEHKRCLAPVKIALVHHQNAERSLCADMRGGRAATTVACPDTGLKFHLSAATGDLQCEFTDPRNRSDDCQDYDDKCCLLLGWLDFTNPLPPYLLRVKQAESHVQLEAANGQRTLWRLQTKHPRPLCSIFYDGRERLDFCDLLLPADPDDSRVLPLRSSVSLALTEPVTHYMVEAFGSCSDWSVKGRPVSNNWNIFRATHPGAASWLGGPGFPFHREGSAYLVDVFGETPCDGLALTLTGETFRFLIEFRTNRGEEIEISVTQRERRVYAAFPLSNLFAWGEIPTVVKERPSAQQAIWAMQSVLEDPWLLSAEDFGAAVEMQHEVEEDEALDTVVLPSLLFQTDDDRMSNVTNNSSSVGAGNSGGGSDTRTAASVCGVSVLIACFLAAAGYLYAFPSANVSRTIWNFLSSEKKIRQQHHHHYQQRRTAFIPPLFGKLGVVKAIVLRLMRVLLGQLWWQWSAVAAVFSDFCRVLGLSALSFRSFSLDSLKQIDAILKRRGQAPRGNIWNLSNPIRHRQQQQEDKSCLRSSSNSSRRGSSAKRHIHPPQHRPQDQQHLFQIPQRSSNYWIAIWMVDKMRSLRGRLVHCSAMFMFLSHRTTIYKDSRKEVSSSPQRSGGPTEVPSIPPAFAKLAEQFSSNGRRKGTAALSSVGKKKNRTKSKMGQLTHPAVAAACSDKEDGSRVPPAYTADRAQKLASLESLKEEALESLKASVTEITANEEVCEGADKVKEAADVKSEDKKEPGAPSEDTTPGVSSSDEKCAAATTFPATAAPVLPSDIKCSPELLLSSETASSPLEGSDRGTVGTAREHEERLLPRHHRTDAAGAPTKRQEETFPKKRKNKRAKEKGDAPDKNHSTLDGKLREGPQNHPPSNQQTWQKQFVAWSNAPSVVEQPKLPLAITPTIAPMPPPLLPPSAEELPNHIARFWEPPPTSPPPQKQKWKTTSELHHKNTEFPRPPWELFYRNDDDSGYTNLIEHRTSQQQQEEVMRMAMIAAQPPKSRFSNLHHPSWDTAGLAELLQHLPSPPPPPPPLPAPPLLTSSPLPAADSTFGFAPPFSDWGEGRERPPGLFLPQNELAEWAAKLAVVPGALETQVEQLVELFLQQPQNLYDG